MVAKTHFLFSHSEDIAIQWFDKFDREVIKNAIVEHLTKNPSDTIEHCKEFNKHDLRKFAGNDILGLYGVNPKNGAISKIITKGDKDYYITLSTNK